MCSVLAFALMFADHRFAWMETARAQLSTVVAPVQWAVSLPSKGLSWVSMVVTRQDDLIAENRHLQGQLLTLSQRVQRMASLSAENDRLRQLLKATPRGHVPYITAELMMLDNDPFIQQMIVDRGQREGIYVGQPVVDASGLAGQVISVSRYTSRVLLVTDASHAVPIQINRNGLRFIVQGTGRPDGLEVLHVPNNADIREGDLLVTSGLAHRFPEGYPVARVTRVQHDPGGPFANVEARPMAQIDRSRQFLMLYTRDLPEEEAAALDPQAVVGALQVMGVAPAEPNVDDSHAP